MVHKIYVPSFGITVHTGLVNKWHKGHGYFMRTS